MFLGLMVFGLNFSRSRFFRNIKGIFFIKGIYLISLYGLLLYRMGIYKRFFKWGFFVYV